MVDADKAVEEFPHMTADEMSMKRWSQRMKDSIHLWEMEMKIVLSDTRFDADDVRFVLMLEGQFTCKPESRSQKVELCGEGQLSKCRARNLADRESGRVELDRSDVLKRESRVV